MRRAANLTFQDWLYLARAVSELLIARIRHATRPTGRIIKDLRAATRASDLPTRAAGIDVAKVGWAIQAAAARVPWRSDCLPQAMAAHRWLTRTGHHPQLYVGVAKDADGELIAHAWLRCEELTVTGAVAQEYLTLISPSKSG
jgi:hypothetical protein